MKEFVRTNVAGIIMNMHGEILIAQRAYTKKLLPGAWHLPGDKVEEGESFETALRRELHEEFQLQESDIQTLTMTDKQFEYQLGGEWHRTVLGQIQLAHNFVPVLDFETEQAVFLLPKTCLQLLESNDVLYTQHVTMFKVLGLIE